MKDAQKKFRRRAEARPDEVLDAALAVFGEKGFAATKVEDIARLAGVSKGTVYLYFPSKEALLEGIVQRAVAPVAAGAAFDMANFEGDPRLPITMLMRALVELLSQPEKLAVPRLIMREVLNFPWIVEMYRRNVLDRVLPVLIGLMSRGMEQGHFRKLDPEMAARSVMGPVIAHIALSEIFGIRPADGLAMERFMATHLDILFNGLEADR